jgi:hypothetical protein
MNPPINTTGLFLTPRGPYGRRLPERARKHLHASENKVWSALKNGAHWLGQNLHGEVGAEKKPGEKTDIHGELSLGKPPSEAEDFLADTRTVYNPDQAARQKQRDQEKKEKTAKASQAAKPAQSVQPARPKNQYVPSY